LAPRQQGETIAQHPRHTKTTAPLPGVPQTEE
jgi:hypothetical protein